MSAVARVWWTFFTAFPLQRWLASVGGGLGALLAIGGLVSGSALWIFAGLLVLFIFAVFPALFTSAAVFRALSAPRANQLLPHLRMRMLGAVALFVAAILALITAVFLSVASVGGRTMPLEWLIFAFAFATATFLLMFLQFGDWRWMWLWVAAAFGLVGMVTVSSSAGSALPAIPAWVWLGAALAAWTLFAAWYARVRRIRPVMLLPGPEAGRWSRANLEGPITREFALRALVTAKVPRSQSRALAVGSVVGVVLNAVVIAALLSQAGRFLSFTSFVWPFATMILLWGRATSIVHRSRLLWLRLPGPRETVRREIERALLRNLGSRLILLVGVAAIYASPLVAAAPQEVVAGFALAACAGLYGTYVALAAVPSGHLHVASFGVMIVIQLALLTRTSPSLTVVGIVTAVELGGAILFRALAVRRWQRIDWLRLHPLPVSKP